MHCAVIEIAYKCTDGLRDEQIEGGGSGEREHVDQVFVVHCFNLIIFFGGTEEMDPALRCNEKKRHSVRV